MLLFDRFEISRVRLEHPCVVQCFGNLNNGLPHGPQALHADDSVPLQQAQQVALPHPDRSDQQGVYPLVQIFLQLSEFRLAAYRL